MIVLDSRVKRPQEIEMRTNNSPSYFLCPKKEKRQELTKSRSECILWHTDSISLTFFRTLTERSPKAGQKRGWLFRPFSDSSLLPPFFSPLLLSGDPTTGSSSLGWLPRIQCDAENSNRHVGSLEKAGQVKEAGGNKFLDSGKRAKRGCEAREGVRAISNTRSGPRRPALRDHLALT